MSIQSTVNQGISLMGLLMSQMPSVKAREDEAAAARARETAAATAEGRLEEERKFKAQTEEERRNKVRSDWAAQSALVEPYHSKSRSAYTAENLSRRRQTREAALETGRALYEFEATPELADILAGYDADISGIKEEQQRRAVVAKEEQREEGRNKAERRRQKRKEAEESAAAAMEEEQHRQAIYDEITRPFDPNTDKFSW